MNRRVLALIVCLPFCAHTWAESPVHFPDPHMKAAIEEALWIVDPEPNDMLGLISLECSGGWDRRNAISDLTGLEYADHLQSLTLSCHQFSDLSPLSGLTELRTLTLQMNLIGDLSPLSGLSNLQDLDVESNQISDISPLSGLENLSHLSLHKNPVSDISPLVGMPSLSWVDLRGAPLNLDAYEIHIPQLYADRPDMLIVYDPYIYRPRTVAIESTPGGMVTDPGEGEFTFDYGQLIRLEAQADPCFVFIGWSGSYSGEQNPAYLSIDQDHSIGANFVSLLDELYVDDDAAGDPGPGDRRRSDPLENGTAAHPFDCIQEAITVATHGVSIVVCPGTYREDIDLLGKRIFLKAVDPADSHAGPCAVIEGSGNGPVVRIAGGGTQCGLSGFIITRGRGVPAGAICCTYSSPRLTNCLIAGNRCLDPEGAAVYFYDSRAVLTNCTLANNYGGPDGAGLMLVDSDIQMINSVLWANTPTEIRSTGTSNPSIRYCCVRGWWPDVGNIHADPLFVRSGCWVSSINPNTVLEPGEPWAVWTEGDYHVKSQAGRWDPAARLWLRDEATSPCVDAGDPAGEDRAGHEPLPNGQRMNLGVYGGTGQASMSLGGS